MSAIEHALEGPRYCLDQTDPNLVQREAAGLSTIPPEIIKKIIFTCSDLSIERLEKLLTVSHKWCEIVCTSEIWKIGVFEKLLRIFPSIQVFDKYKWEEIVDLEAEGLIIDDFPPFEIPQLKKLKELFSSMCSKVEGGFGATLLTLPQNLSLNGLIHLSKSPKKGHPTDFCQFRPSPLARVGNVPVNKTYRILITNTINSGTRNQSFKEHTAKDPSFIAQLPDLLEVATLLATTHIRSKKKLYGEDTNSCTVTFCSHQETLGEKEFIGVAGSFGDETGIQLTCVKKEEGHNTWGAGGVCRLASWDPQLFPEIPRNSGAFFPLASPLMSPSALRVNLRDSDLLSQFTHFDPSDWKKFFDVSVDEIDLFPFDTPVCLALGALRSLLPSIEKQAGITLLTMPAGLTVNHLLKWSETLELEFPLKILEIWEGIGENLCGVPIHNTYRIAITNHVFSDSWGLSVEEEKGFIAKIEEKFTAQSGLIAKFKCRIPKLIENAFLIFAMHVKSHFQFYYHNNHYHFARCSEQIGQHRAGVGNFHSEEGFELRGCVLGKIPQIGFGGVIEIPSFSKGENE